MFVAIYHFTVKKGEEHSFKESWKKLTELILEYENSLGSRLHKSGERNYIAYAQWHSREQWENAGGNLPESANEYRSMMKKCCQKIKTIHELEVMVDLLIKP